MSGASSVPALAATRSNGGRRPRYSVTGDARAASTSESASEEGLRTPPGAPIALVEAKYQIESSEHRCVGCAADIGYGAAYYSAVVFVADEQVFGRRDFCVACWESREADADPSPARYFAFWRTRRPEPNEAPPARVRFDAEIVFDFFRHLDTAASGLGDMEASGLGDMEASGLGDMEASGLGDMAASGLGDMAASGLGDMEASGLGDGAERPGADSSDDGFGADDDDLLRRSSGARLLPNQQRDLRFVLSLLLLRKKVLNFSGSAMEDGREWLKLSDKSVPPRDYWVENPELADAELERVRDDLGELLQMKV